jgi:hypothetical protein
MLLQAIRYLIIFSILAYEGQLAVEKFDGQWRVYLRRPWSVVATLICWGLMELIIYLVSLAASYSHPL